MKVELTEHEAHLISEVFDTVAYPDHPLYTEICTVAEDCGVTDEVGTDHLMELFESIWKKTNGLEVKT